MPVLQCGARLVLAGGLGLLAACGEAQAPQRPPSATTVSTPGASPAEEAGADQHAAGAWLERSDPTPPGTWLAARSAPPIDPARLAVLLKEADMLFDETPRMLANRTAQLHVMLQGIAVEEAPDALLQGFVAVGRRGGRIGYSDLCQHYFNLRKSGLDRPAALAALVRPGAEGVRHEDGR